jgi:glycosyltransferase involved in cell wall biosynthesis
MNLYLTADRIDGSGGGSSVVREELAALCSLGECVAFGREQLEQGCPGWRGLTNEEPWIWDEIALGKAFTQLKEIPKLCHLYAGTFTRTVLQAMKQNGVKVSYTAAAHNVQVSQEAHRLAGIPFNYPHLTDPELWKRYVGGYLAADVVICPSKHSAEIMKGYGCKRVEVIPHGVNLPDPANVMPLPSRFTVGYLGNCAAPDKGLIYLLQAWKRLNYKDAVLLLGGHDSNSEYVRALIQQHGGGSIITLGWVKEIYSFFNSLSLYVQPSVTEGFGLEVLEACSFGRPVLCSTGAGAVDVLGLGQKHSFVCGMYFDSCDVEMIASMINTYKQDKSRLIEDGEEGREQAKKYTWEIIRQKYVSLWQSLLAGS